MNGTIMSDQGIAAVFWVSTWIIAYDHGAVCEVSLECLV